MAKLRRKLLVRRYKCKLALQTKPRLSLSLSVILFPPLLHSENFQIIVRDLILDEEEQIKYMDLFQLYCDLIPHFERTEKFTRDQIGDFARKQSLFYKAYIDTCGYESKFRT